MGESTSQAFAGRWHDKMLPKAPEEPEAGVMLGFLGEEVSFPSAQTREGKEVIFGQSYWIVTNQGYTASARHTPD